MLKYMVLRILAIIPIMGMVAVFIFLIMHLMPGDPAALIAGRGATAQEIARIHARLGLDEPLYTQFITWIWGILHGDFGRSLYSNVPVATLIIHHAEPTIALALGGIFFAVVIALPLGMLAARKAGGWVDYVVMAFSVLGFSIPTFLTAYILIFIFSMTLGWFPVQGYVSISEGIIPFLHTIVLPSLGLGFLYAALIARITRASLLGVLGEDYIRTAYAKGLAPRVVLNRHALKNAAVPITTVVGIGFALLIGGVVVTESVFNIPGLGRLVVGAVLAHNYPVIQGVVLIFSAVYVILNLIVDLACALFDPRIRSL